MSEEQPQAEQQEEKKEESQADTLVGVFRQFAGSPVQQQIDQWKIDHGEVFVSGFSETELYVFRPITRPEWIELQTLVADPKNEIDQFKFEEIVVDTCILWKSSDGAWAAGKAGTVGSLHEQIMQQSNFMSPQAAAMLVAKL